MSHPPDSLTDTSAVARPPVTALIGFGANQGDPIATFQAAIEALGRTEGVRVTRVSRLYRTTAVGGPTGQRDYTNGVIRCETTLAPEQLLGVLQRIETRLGRERKERWGPRVVDLDLLLVGDALRHTEHLVLPHPRMAFRAFVLEPACEVASEITDPRTGWTLQHLREHMERSPKYVVICGVNMPAKRRLMAAIANRFPLRRIQCPVAYEQLLSSPGDLFIEKLLAPLHRSSALFQGLTAQEWVCSDYSLRELLSWSTVYLREPDRSQPIARSNLETAALMDAKFTLFLDTPVGNGRIDASTSESVEQAIAFAAALREEMTQKNRGPVLHLTTADENTVVEEALAAMQASCPTDPER
ncbi:MAG: 2-amino-4-hydroxy-6-hydroxymethyldihydropteridine pyrophosphokinae [Planctomycetota bacterium]